MFYSERQPIAHTTRHAFEMQNFLQQTEWRAFSKQPEGKTSQDKWGRKNFTKFKLKQMGKKNFKNQTEPTEEERRTSQKANRNEVGRKNFSKIELKQWGRKKTSQKSKPKTRTEKIELKN